MVHAIGSQRALKLEAWINRDSSSRATKSGLASPLLTSPQTLECRFSGVALFSLALSFAQAVSFSLTSLTIANGFSLSPDSLNYVRPL